MSDRPPQITELLRQIDGRPAEQLNLLFERLYGELRRIAARRLRAERPGHTLSSTALVNEAWLKLSGLEGLEWQNRSQFFALAARAMRQILMNHARDRMAEKRGGDAPMVTLTAGMTHEPSQADFSYAELITVETALDELYELDERQGQIAEMRLFGGLTHAEVAELLEISVPTVERDWRLGRAFLARALE